MPRPAGGVCGDVSFDDISKMVKSKKIDLKKYGRLVIIPTAPYLTGGCSFVGKGDLEFNKKTFHISLSWVGGGAFNEPSSWGSQSFKWSNLDYAMAHELGHALGIMHANGLDCGDESLYNECTHVEYGNYFDTMGAGGYSLQFNALYKELLGWIVPSRIAVLSPGVKTNLSPLESDKGVVLLKVPQTPGSKTTPYYLEYRQGVGFDRALNNAEFSNNQQGIFINKKVVVEGGFNFPQLIDATPTLDSWWDDIKQVTLNSSTFSDPGRGIRVSTRLQLSNILIHQLSTILSDQENIHFSP